MTEAQRQDTIRMWIIALAMTMLAAIAVAFAAIADNAARESEAGTKLPPQASSPAR